MANDPFTMKARIAEDPDEPDHYHFVEWISDETDDKGQPLFRRIPEPTENEFKKDSGFYAAGEFYNNFKELAAETLDDSRGTYRIFRDKFGRTVLFTIERFPCFDSADAMYENRFYHWFYIVHDDKLTCVYYSDDSDIIKVTEDVRVMELRAWENFEFADIIKDDILQIKY